MPQRSGFLVLENIRRNRPDPLPVIMITPTKGSRHKAYAEMLGVHDYLRKPFSIDSCWRASSRALKRPEWSAPHLSATGSGRWQL